MDHIRTKGRKSFHVFKFFDTLRDIPKFFTTFIFDTDKEM